jgi:hypothetical protein
VMAPELDEIAPTADSYEETRYYLTDTGKKRVEELMRKEEYKPFVEGIRKVKSRFAVSVLVGALAAWYKYGDRTDLTDKSLKGTKEAMDGLEAYLGRTLAARLRPSIERIVTGDRSAESILKELSGEDFQSDISSFIDDDVEEIVWYWRLSHARTSWSSWARRISWAVLILSVMEAIFSAAFAVLFKIFNHPLTMQFAMVSFVASGAAVAFCFLSGGAMLYHHDKISKYREKVL